MKKLITIILGLLALPTLTLAQNQQPTGDFTVHPTYKHGDNQSWIVDTVNPGDSYTDFLTLQNLSDKQQTITLRVHEGEQKETFIINETTNYEHLGNWVALPQETHILAPNETKKIPIQITVPHNTTPNKYTGTILASQSRTTNQNVNIVTRIGVRIYLTVSNQNLQTNILNTQYSPIFLLLSFLGLAGAITLNVMSFRQNK